MRNGAEASTPPIPADKNDERGGGGKIRREFDRRPLLPYARVPDKKDENDGGGWWQSASRLFSFFSKRPSIISDDNDSQQQPHDSTGSAEATENGSGEGHATIHDIQNTRPKEDGQSPLADEVSNCVDTQGEDTSRRPFDSIGISEIEHMFEGKTLSRDEFSRLKEILQSRITIESDAEGPGERDLDATKGEDAVVASLRQETLKQPADKTEVFLNRVLGESSTPFPKSTSDDLVGASPIDIAKAYMGRRTSEFGVSSKSVVFQEKTTPSSARGGLPKSPGLSPRPKSSIGWPGSMGQQSYYNLTPQTERGRVGIHSSLRTPYSRPVHSSTISKLERGGDRSHNIPSTNMKHLQTPVYGGQVARTSYSSFTDSFGSVGPVRRSRRKFRLTTTPSKGTESSRSAAPPSWSEGLYARKNFLPMVKQNLDPGTSSGSSSKFQPEDMMAPSGICVSTVHPPVQPQPTDMDRILLEHFDRTIATPEKKSAELKLATSWRKLSSPDSTTSKGKAADSLLVENSVFQLSGHVIGQNFIGPEKEVRGASLQNDLLELKKTDEGTNSVNTSSLGTRLLSRESSPGNIALTFDTNLSKGSKRNPEFGVSRDEAPMRQESSQNERNIYLPQQKEAIRGQTFPRLSDNNYSYKAPNIPKKPSAHTFGNKPDLPDISITKSNLSCKASVDNGYTFTFPVPSSSGTPFEPPTPSILPSFSATALPMPSNNYTLDGELSYSFGSKTSREALVFSFTSTPSSDCSMPKFTFGSGEGRISFSSVNENAVCS